MAAHLISSKRNTEFSDHPMPEAYPVYPRHQLFLQYLRDLARHFRLYERTRFGARVVRLEPEGANWRVSCEGRQAQTYRGVFVANGLQREPYTPPYPGIFTGQTLHSSQYRQSGIFRDKRVLVVGGGNSGCDIAVDAVHAGDGENYLGFAIVDTDASGNANFSIPELHDLQSRATTLSAFGDFSEIGFTMIGLGEPRVVRAGVVGGSYFSVMGLKPVVGRLLDATDDGPKAAGAAVLTYRFWTTALNSGCISRGSSHPNSVCITNATPPLPD